MSMTQNYSTHVAKVVASLPLYFFHISVARKKKYFLQKKNTEVQVVMNLDCF